MTFLFSKKLIINHEKIKIKTNILNSKNIAFNKKPKKNKHPLILQIQSIGNEDPQKYMYINVGLRINLENLEVKEHALV